MNAENNRSVGTILQDVMKDLSEIVRSEIKLAKTELKQEAAQLGRAVPMLAIGGVFGLSALGLAFATGVLALSLIMPPWAAALILFAFATIVAGLFLGMGMVRLRGFHLKPENTIRSLQEGTEWLKTQTR